MRPAPVLAIVAVLLAGCGGETSGPPARPPLPRRSESARRTVAVSEEVAPSAEARTVRHGEQVAVTVPGGLLKAPAKVTIASVELEPAPESPALEKLCCWDVSVGDLHELDRPVTIELAVDPARLPRGARPEDALASGYWDPAAGAWVSSPLRYDAARGRVVIEARHLSLRSVWAVGSGYQTSLSTHFRIVYNPAAGYPMLNKDRARELKDLALAFVLETRSCLESAWDAYAAAGFRMPGSRLDVYVDKWGADKTAEWGAFLGDIDIPVTYDDLRDLRHDSAHELFHAVQNEYFSVPSMATRMWWVESTADFAADRIAWGSAGGTGKMGENIKPAYCSRSFSFSGAAAGDPHYRHEYHTAHWLGFLAGRDAAGFKAMWDAVCSEKLPLATVKPLEDYALRSSRSLMSARYREFAAWLLLDAASPLPRDARPFSGSTLGPGALPAGKASVDNEIALEPDYTAVLWGVRVGEPPAGIKARRLLVRAEGKWPAPARTECAVYLLPADARQTGGARPLGIVDRDKPELALEAGKDQWVGLLAVNCSPEARALGVKVEAQPQLEVGRPLMEVEHGVIGCEYTFRARHCDLPAEASFNWSFGDGNSGTGESVTHKYTSAGKYQVKVTAGSAAGRKVEAGTVFVVDPDKKAVRCEVDFLVYRRYKNPMGQSKQACNQFTLTVTSKATGQVVESGESIARNGHLALNLPPGDYTCVARYKFTLPPDHGTAGASFSVREGGRNQVEIEATPYEGR